MLLVQKKTFSLLMLLPIDGGKPAASGWLSCNTQHRAHRTRSRNSMHSRNVVARRLCSVAGVAPDLPSCSRVEQSRQNFPNGIGCDGSRQVDNFSRNRDVDEFRCVFLVGILCSNVVYYLLHAAVELCLLFSFPNVTVRQSDSTY